MEKFGIKSKHFSLLKAFKEEAEKLGWNYVDIHSAWTEVPMTDTIGLYFGGDLGMGMSLSKYSRCNKEYELPLEWNAALGALKIKKDVEVSIQEIANWKGVPAELIKIKQ